MLTTLCESCGQMSPLPSHNSPSYWYCKFCKFHLEPQNIQQLMPPTLREKVLHSFPQATSFRATEGEVVKGGEVIIDVAKVTEETNEIPSRPLEKSLQIFAHIPGGDQKLGEFFYS